MIDAKLQDCPANVCDQIGLFVHRIQEILSDDLRGIYLHGSLALGCFNSNRSDIDLLILTHQQPSLEKEQMVAEEILQSSRNPSPLELSILHTGQFDPWRHPTPFDFHFSEDWREQIRNDLQTVVWRRWYDREKIDGDLAAHFTVTRMRGICLYGEPIGKIVPIVPLADFKDSVLSDMRWARERAMKFPAYGILNFCRICAFVQGEAVLSKIEGAEWALCRFPTQYHRLISDALKIYKENVDAEFLETEVLNFMDFVAQRIARLDRNNDDSIELIVEGDVFYCCK